MESKRLFYSSFVLMVLFMFTGCGHMTEVNKPENTLTSFSENFMPSRIYEIDMHDIAYDSEGMYGLNYYVALMKEGAKTTDNIKKSGELISTQILKVNGVPKLFLFDYGKKVDRKRKILIQSRVVPGIQYPVSGGDELICGRGIRQFDWELYKTIDDYVADGSIKVTEIDSENDPGHNYATKIIFNILTKYKTLDDDTTFEKFLKGLGSFSSNEIHLMIAGSFNPTQLYPAIGVKVFSILRALSGSADLSDIYYYTKKASAFDVAAMLHRNKGSLKIKIQNEIYLENKLQNKNLFEIEMKELLAWKDNEIEKIEEWRLTCFGALEIDPADKGLDEIDRESAKKVNDQADKYIDRIEQRYAKRAAFYKELYNE